MSIYTPQTPRTLAHQQTSLFQSFQYTSPTSDYLTQSIISTATTSSNSPQVTLLQRWHSLSSEIETRRLSRVAVVEINRCLDKAENLLFRDTSSSEMSPKKKDKHGLGIADSVDGSSSLNMSETLPMESSGQNAPEAVISAQGEVQIARQASQLLERISRAAQQLRQRQEDFKHFHNTIIAKAEQSAEKIQQLEAEVEQAEADIADDQSELTYLKLKVRILEIQALPYVPFREKDSLAEGIRRWKLDWADVANRFRTRTRRRNVGKGSTILDDSFMNNNSL